MAESTLNLTDLIVAVRSELEKADTTLRAAGKPALFRLAGMELELTFVVKSSVNFNWAVMREGPFSYTDLLPEKMMYGEVCNNIATRADLIKLIQDAVPTLSPSRLAQL